MPKSLPLNGWPRISQISNLHNFCYTTPNSIFETSIESPQYEDQTHKFSIAYEQSSMSYTQSKFCFKPSTTSTVYKLPQNTTKESLPNLFDLKWTWALQPMSPYPKYPTRYFLTFLSFPLSTT